MSYKKKVDTFFCKRILCHQCYIKNNILTSVKLSKSTKIFKAKLSMTEDKSSVVCYEIFSGARPA
jgi:hypothetical protein